MGELQAARALGQEELENIAGTVTGQLAAADQLAAEQAIAAGADWPHWEGPTANCIAALSGAELVDDLKKARLVWKSEVAP